MDTSGVAKTEGAVAVSFTAAEAAFILEAVDKGDLLDDTGVRNSLRQKVEWACLSKWSHVVKADLEAGHEHVYHSCLKVVDYLISRGLDDAEAWRWMALPSPWVDGTPSVLLQAGEYDRVMEAAKAMASNWEL